MCQIPGPISVSNKMSYCKISQGLEPARVDAQNACMITLNFGIWPGKSEVEMYPKFQGE